ncbi:MAG: hypothetical protein J7L71_00485 [Spirochaetaceae bacterium]|nr:hypothetical protein [Spirochaetaceae bacterium]
MSFGRAPFMDHDITGESNNIVLMPGLGISFRSLGKIFGNYGFTIYTGPVKVEALNDLYNNNGDSETQFLNSGESTWITFSFISLKAGVSWNFNEHWSLKSRMTLFLSPLAFTDTNMINYTVMARGSLFSIAVQTGIGYRW